MTIESGRRLPCTARGGPHPPESVIIHNPAPADGPECLAETDLLETVAAVEDALRSKGWNTRRIELPRPLSLAAEVLARLPREVPIFNLFEGYPGDPASEFHVALMLKSLGFKSTGCPPESILLCLLKNLAKVLLASRGFRCAPHRLVTLPEDADIAPPHALPAFIKPNFSDASHGVTHENLVTTPEALHGKTVELLERFPEGLLVEPYLPGREICCSVVEVGGAPVPLPPSLLDFSALPREIPPIFTFEAKWDTSAAAFDKTHTRCPAPLPEPAIRQLEAWAVEAFLALGCRGYARVDFREGAENEWFVMEINPNCTIHPDALMAGQAQVFGWGYPDLIDAVLRAASEGRPWT